MLSQPLPDWKAFRRKLTETIIDALREDGRTKRDAKMLAAPIADDIAQALEAFFVAMNAPRPRREPRAIKREAKRCLAFYKKALGEASFSKLIEADTSELIAPFVHACRNDPERILGAFKQWADSVERAAKAHESLREPKRNVFRAMIRAYVAMYSERPLASTRGDETNELRSFFRNIEKFASKFGLEFEAGITEANLKALIDEFHTP